MKRHDGGDLGESAKLTGELIPKERLRAVPHATLSVASKQARDKK